MQELGKLSPSPSNRAMEQTDPVYLLVDTSLKQLETHTPNLVMRAHQTKANPGSFSKVASPHASETEVMKDKRSLRSSPDENQELCYPNAPHDSELRSEK